MSGVIALEIAGNELPLRPTKANSGNIFHALRKADGKFRMAGVAIPALDDELPEKVTVGGVVVGLEDVLSSTYQGKVTTYAPGQKRRGSHSIEVDGEDRNFKITLSIRKDGNWNVVAAITRRPGAAAVDLGDL